MGQIRPRFFAMVVVPAVIALMVLAPAATAAGVTASFAAPTLSIAGDAAGGDVRVVRDAGGTIHVFLDATELTVTGGPATVTNTDTVDQSLQPTDGFTIDLGGGAFTPGATHHIDFTGPAPGQLTILGSSGPDDIRWVNNGIDITSDGDGDVVIGVENKVIYDGRGGDDHLAASSQTGPSTCSGWDIDTLVMGGPGDDYVSGAFDIADDGYLARLTGGSGVDTLVALECPGVQFLAAESQMNGGGGPDSLTGGDNTNSPDTIRGGPGADTLDGAGGPDLLLGNGGDDTLVGVDTVSGNDTVNGQAGVDACNADAGDALSHCETVAPAASHHGRMTSRGAALRVTVRDGVAVVRAG